MGKITVNEEVSMLIVTREDIYSDIRGICLAVDYRHFTAEIMLAEPLLGDHDKEIAPIGATVFFTGKDIVNYLHPVKWIDKDNIERTLDDWNAYRAYLKNRENKLLSAHETIGEIEIPDDETLTALKELFAEVKALEPVVVDAVESADVDATAPAGATKSTDQEKTAARDSLKTMLAHKRDALKPVHDVVTFTDEKIPAPKKPRSTRNGKK